MSDVAAAKAKFAGFIGEVRADLADAREAWYAQLTADQQPIVDAAIEDLAALAASTITDPTNAAHYAREMLYPLSTLESEAGLAAIRAKQRVRRLIARTILRLAAEAVEW